MFTKQTILWMVNRYHPQKLPDHQVIRVIFSHNQNELWDKVKIGLKESSFQVPTVDLHLAEFLLQRWKKTQNCSCFAPFFLANLTGWPWRSVQLYTMTAWWVIYTFCVNDTCKYMLHVYVSFYLFQIRKKCMVWLRHDSYTTDLLVPIQIRETDMYANVACTVDTNSVHTYTANRKSATANFKHLTFVFFRARSIQPGTKKRMSSYQNIH